MTNVATAVPSPEAPGQRQGDVGENTRSAPPRVSHGERRQTLWLHASRGRKALLSVVAQGTIVLLSACVDSPTAVGRTPTLVSEQAQALAFRESEWGRLLTARLGDSSGACVVIHRLSNGKYVSRRTTILLPAEPESGTLLRFAYRGWRPGVPTPSKIVICNIKNRDASKRYLSERFAGEKMTSAQLTSFLVRNGVDSAFAVIQDSRIELGVHFVDGLDIPRQASASIAAGTVENGPVADYQECPPQERRSGPWTSSHGTAVVPRVSATPQQPSMELVCGDWMEEGEYVPEEEPEPGPDVEETVVSGHPEEPDTMAYATPITCTILSEFPHKSTTMGYVGNLNAKSRTTCPVTLLIGVGNMLSRHTCIWFVCWDNPISVGYQQRVHVYVESIASATCGWRDGWYRNQAVHSVAFFNGAATGRTATPWRRLGCFQP